MTKTQLNIKISKELLIRVKKDQIISGKSLTQHVTELISNSLTKNNIENTNATSNNKIKNSKKRLLALESVVRTVSIYERI